LLPRPFVTMRRLGPARNHAGGADQLVTPDVLPQLHRVEPLVVAKIDGMRLTAPRRRNEQLRLTSVGQRDGDEGASLCPVGRDDLAVRGGHAVLLLELPRIDGLRA